MTEQFVDAALTGAPDRAFFFIQDQYVVWDYSIDTRVVDGVQPIESFPPGSITGLPFELFNTNDRRASAALRGKQKYFGASHFFSGSSYCRFEEATGTFGEARDTATVWQLPAGAASPDACFNGAKNRKTY